MVRNAILSVPGRKELAVSTTRTEQVKQYTCELLTAIDNEEFRSTFEEFSAKLLGNLKAAIQITKPATVSKAKERMWMDYAALRANVLPKVWSNFLTSVNCPHLVNEPLLAELINEEIFEGMIIEMYGLYETVHTPPQERSILSKDEDNIIRYACGYIVRTMLQKYLKQHGEKAASFVECISRMQADHTDDKPLSSFLDYTCEWIGAVNRGGLYEVKNEVYLLFREIEARMQSHLMVHLRTLPAQSQSSKATIVNLVQHNSNVQFYWSIVNADIQNEGWSEELLNHLITSWMTIRGFSISSQWMEEYKRVMQIESKKKKGLRKELKQMSN